MAPNTTSTSETDGVLAAESAEDVAGELQADRTPKRIIVWRNVLLFAYLHTAALYGIYLMCTATKLLTILWALILSFACGFGITAGAHRLWAHRTYKANLPLRLLLAFFQTIAFQNDILEWARDHRVHHKFSETDADPHNAKRGFFFSHIGWLLVRKHPDVKLKGQHVDISDLKLDPVVYYQKKFYIPLVILCCFVIPTFVPYHFWDEALWNSWFVAGLLRYCITLNATWLVNSAAHIWGNKPYNRYINPSENLFVAISAVGEGWHNYHHTFPWDYKTAELGNYKYNLTTAFIDFFEKIGWATNLKTVSQEMVRKRVEQTGDGSHPVWGWGDKDLKED